MKRAPFSRASKVLRRCQITGRLLSRQLRSVLEALYPGKLSHKVAALGLFAAEAALMQQLDRAKQAVVTGALAMDDKPSAWSISRPWKKVKKIKRAECLEARGLG